MQETPYYPIFLNLSARKCVVVGGGQVALRKVKVLLEHGADVQVISPDLCPGLKRLAEAGKIQVASRDYTPGDLANAFIVVAATSDNDINEKVAEEAKQRGILVNVVDDLQRSDFIVPSYLRRGDVTIAVSTGGKSPALARRLRSELERNLGDEYALLAVVVGEVRSELRRKGIKVGGDDWQQALDLEKLLGMLKTGRSGEARDFLLSSLESLGQKE